MNLESLEKGAKIQDTQLILGDESRKKLSELMGPQGMILYFYPKDNTPGCTTQACDFRDHAQSFASAGYSIVGVSGDSSASHQSFAQKQRLRFPLVTDTGHKLAKALGVYGEKNLYGRIMQGIRRTSFVLNPALEVVKVYQNVRAKGHVERLLRDMENRFAS